MLVRQARERTPFRSVDRERIELWLQIHSERRRANWLHKLDALITALRVFRKGLDALVVLLRRRLDWDG
jgi:hypothetical protein